MKVKSLSNTMIKKSNLPRVTTPKLAIQTNCTFKIFWNSQLWRQLRDKILKRNSFLEMIFLKKNSLFQIKFQAIPTTTSSPNELFILFFLFLLSKRNDVSQYSLLSPSSYLYIRIITFITCFSINNLPFIYFQTLHCMSAWNKSEFR